MASTQRWYVAEQEPQAVLTPPPPNPQAETVAGFTDAQVTAIAAEAGVPVEFVRQSLQEPLQTQSVSTTAQTTNTDYWQVTLRLRKPRRLPRRLKKAALVLPLCLGALYTLLIHLVINYRLAPFDHIYEQLLVFSAPILAFLLGIILMRKRLGVLSGAWFGTTFFIAAFLAVTLNGQMPYGLSLWSDILLPWLICVGAGTGAGLLGALTYALMTFVAQRYQKRRRRHAHA